MRRAFVSTALRLFTVQGSWNHDRMLGLGLGYATEPLLRELPGGVSGDRYRAAMRRAGGYFNAHPYLTGLAAGAIARAEHDGIAGEQVERLRTVLLGPLGSVGDRLIWAGTLPAASGLGLVLSATAPIGVGAATFFVLHNLAHLVVRFWVLRAGWRLGTAVARALASPALVTALKIVGPAAPLLVGAALPITGAWLVGDLDVAARVAAAVMFVVALLVTRWIAPTLRGTRLGLLAAAAVLVGEWM